MGSTTPTLTTSKPPVIVIVPGASQNPAHYAHLAHLLHQAGYPTFSALLPSSGASDKVTAEDDAIYIRKRMLEPILNVEGHDVILLGHSYSGMPMSAAAKGLGKTERAAQGWSSSVIGQIFIASILPRGGDGLDVVTALGGGLPPHLYVDQKANLLRCDNPIPYLYQDLPPPYAQTLSQACICPGYTSFTSPCPRASWDDPDFKGRVAYIRTLKDCAIPVEAQNAMMQGTGVEWIVRDVEGGHSPQVAGAEGLCVVLTELAAGWRGV